LLLSSRDYVELKIVGERRGEERRGEERAELIGTFELSFVLNFADFLFLHQQYFSWLSNEFIDGSMVLWIEKSVDYQ
jgi:hypothetical protein